MKVAIPNTTETITGETFYPTPSWFTFFQNVWRAIRGDLGLSLSGMLKVDTTSAENSGTGATDLITYSLPANSLTNDGDVLEIKAWGKYAANSNNKTVALAFGSQTILTTGIKSANDATWSIKATIIRTSESSQEIVSEIISSHASVLDSATRTAGTQTNAAALIIKCVGTGGATSDITQYALKINLTPNT